MSNKWFNIRVKTEGDNYDAVRSRIYSAPQEIFTKYYFQQLQKVAAAGASYIRYIIASSTTPTGERRAAIGGGEPGRIDTGEMLDKVKVVVKKNKATGGTIMRVGWVDGTPGYTIFQVLGTKNGVKGMNAIALSQEYMLSEIKKLSKGGTLSYGDPSTSIGE